MQSYQLNKVHIMHCEASTNIYCAKKESLSPAAFICILVLGAGDGKEWQAQKAEEENADLKQKSLLAGVCQGPPGSLKSFESDRCPLPFRGDTTAGVGDQGQGVWAMCL